MARRGSSPERGTASRKVLEFDCGVSAYEPAPGRGIGGCVGWRRVGVGTRRRRAGRMRSARRASWWIGCRRGRRPRSVRPVAARWSRHLDPGRRPARGRAWSDRLVRSRSPMPAVRDAGDRRRARAHADAGHMHAIVDQAGTKSVGEHLYRCVSAMVAAAWKKGCCWSVRTCCAGCAGTALTSKTISMMRTRGSGPAGRWRRPTSPPPPASTNSRPRRRPGEGCGRASSRCSSSPTRGCGGVNTSPSPPTASTLTAGGSPSTGRSSGRGTASSWRRRRTAAGGPPCSRPRRQRVLISPRLSNPARRAARRRVAVPVTQRALGVTQDLYIAPDADLYDRFYQATG